MTPVIAVVGPTAAGKSALGVALAQRFGGEVVNADSMQLYAGMDIGTAKLTMAERQGVPHHLLDIWHPRHAADVATYQRLARAQLDALLEAGRTPVLVGGSGLYVQGGAGRHGLPRHRPCATRRTRGGAGRAGTFERCTPGSSRAIPKQLRRSCPATGDGSSGRSRWWR